MREGSDRTARNGITDPTLTAMAMALVDLALDAGRAVADCTAFVSEQAKMQQAQDHDTLCRVEATRVDMETF